MKEGQLARTGQMHQYYLRSVKELYLPWLACLNKYVQWLYGLSKLYELLQDVAISFSLEGRKKTEIWPCRWHEIYEDIFTSWGCFYLLRMFLYWKNSVVSLTAFKIIILFLICSIGICLRCLKNNLGNHY